MIRFYNLPEECRWLEETALRGHYPPTFKSFSLEGNEDFPRVITLYSEADPLYSDTATRYELRGDNYILTSMEMR